tara:strand:- start:783 stop:1388 length:606 start_codon:yes stop_codon:yes gene_type:complete
MTTRAPSPFAILLDELIKKEREGEKFSNRNIFDSLESKRRQLRKYYINTEEHSNYNAWAKHLYADSVSPICSPTEYFEELREISQTFLDLTRMAHLYLYDVSRGEHWPSLKEPAGFFEREKWKPKDYRVPPATQQDPDREYGGHCGDYIRDYYDGYRNKDHIKIYVQVIARALLFKIDDMQVSLCAFDQEYDKDLFTYLEQ